MRALVGREEEFKLLGRLWSKAGNGKGQVVLLYGEAGIGKSRLLRELVPEHHPIDYPQTPASVGAPYPEEF